MISPLLPIGGAALGSLALQTLRRLPPTDFLHELLGGRSDGLGSSSSHSSQSTPSSTKSTVDLPTAVPKLVAKLRNRLSASGVDLTQPLTLKDDGRGGILVDGDHPDRITVEDLLASDPELAGEFQAVAAAATNVQRQQLSSLGSLSRDFRLRIDATTSTVVFE